MKTCFKCGLLKPIDDFYGHPRMKDGHLNKCKECTKVDSSMRDPVKVREYDRLRAHSGPRRKQFLEAQRRRRKAHPEKASAHAKVSRAVKSGRLTKPAYCQVCLVGTEVLAHHEDYSKPLEVIWMCDPCHKRHHMEPRPFPIPF